MSETTDYRMVQILAGPKLPNYICVVIVLSYSKVSQTCYWHKMSQKSDNVTSKSSHGIIIQTHTLALLHKYSVTLFGNFW